MIADNAGLRDPLGDAFEDLQAYFEQRVHVREEATELLCETLRRAGGHVDAPRAGGDRRRMWLFAIAANVLADHHRAHRRRSRRTGRGQATLTDPAPGPPPPRARQSATPSYTSPRPDVSSSG